MDKHLRPYVGLRPRVASLEIALLITRRQQLLEKSANGQLGCESETQVTQLVTTLKSAQDLARAARVLCQPKSVLLLCVVCLTSAKEWISATNI